MSIRNPWQSGTAALMAVSITAGAIAPLLTAAPSFAQTTFTDVSSSYWAASFIQELARRDVIAGFPDGSFRPDQPVTRAQFAAMVRKAFNKSQKRDAIRFVDVPSSFWAASAITEAYTTGFLAGYPGNRFEPNQNIPREQVLVSLNNGLEYTASADIESTLQFYSDGESISGYARRPVAAATERQIVVNYPNVKFLQPTRTATRAQVAAFIYQALVSDGQATALNSPYIVALGEQPAPTVGSITIPANTVIPVKYDKVKKILVTKDETAPLTVTVSEDVVTSQGQVIIAAGSQVVGELKPAPNGSQFVARELILSNGQRYTVDAKSEVITTKEEVRKGSSVATVIKDAALGAAAAAAVAAVTGDRAIATEEVLGGTGIGALIGLFFGRDKIELIAIKPDTDLQLTLDEDLVVSLR